MSFVNLHNQTYYSILDSLIDPKQLFNKAKELNQKAIAVTDHATLAGAWKSLKISKETGVKLIIGCEIYFKENISSEDEKLKHIVLLAKNQKGYSNLLTINKLGFSNNPKIGKKIYSVADWSLLEKYSEGLICLTACGNGILSQNIMNKKSEAVEFNILKLKEIFKENLAIEVQANNMKRFANFYNDEIDQQFLNKKLIDLGKKHGIKIVPTCNTHYINKSDSDIHDTLLAIGSGMPKHSGFRLKYNVPDFYLKSEEEVLAFFSRNYGEEFAKNIVENTQYFADLCEVPDWIDPKFSNPSGKELPEYSVKDTFDYQQFLAWKSNQSLDLSDDKLYLRYKCEIAFEKIKSTIPEEKHKEYIDRINEEIETLEYQGFSSYMLIVADYLNWCEKVGISIGPGRGCLVGTTKVLTDKGFSYLKDIKIGDKVYSHTGELKEITNTFVFDVKEDLIKFKLENSHGPLTMTSDHKVLASKSLTSEPKWIKAEDLNIKDFVYTKFPKTNTNKYVKTIDLADFITKNNKVEEDKIYINNERYYINRFIEVNDEFLYVLGRWVGDGCIRYKMKSGIHFAFNANDTAGITRINNFFTSLGFKPKTRTYKNSTAFEISINILSNLFKSLFVNYQNKSNTKCLPVFFRELNNNQLKYLINGIADSDGYIRKAGESIKTSSEQLANELKEVFNLLYIPSSVLKYPNVRYGVKNQDSYLITYSGISLPLKTRYLYKDGYYSKIIGKSFEKENYVYDITVDKDHSYLTSSGIVHNSVGGSYTAYLLGIHKADSIKYDLIFERFQNKFKTSFPDIDCDVSTNDRGKVLNYLKTKYGEDNFCSISNINTITPKVYLRDLSRSLEFGGSRDAAVQIGNDLASYVGNDLGRVTDIEKILDRAPLLNEYCKKYPQIRENGKILGLPRSAGVHAAGVIISKRPLVGLAPLRKDKDENFVIEYDKDLSEENGFVKMDVLGLSTLDTIDAVLNEIKKSGKEFNNEHLDYDANDTLTYDLITKGDTFGVFQFGTSGGTIDLCKRIKPKNIEDLAIITTLARPAAAGIRTAFIEAREGKKDTVLLHPFLQRAFGKTYGFCLFDESILQIGKDVAGWNLNDADRLRKLIKDKGKNPEKDKKLREEFITCSIKNGVNEVLAPRIWDEHIAAGSEYTFNKSHAVLYSMISYQTAYLKAHFPIEFLLANLMAETESKTPDAKINIEKIKKELKAHKIKIMPPDINNSKSLYSIENGKLLTGLNALKFVGDSISDIVEKRPFTSFYDFMVRVDSRKVRSNAIQALASAGALDCFKIKRRFIYQYCSDYRKKLQVWLKKHDPKTEEFVYPWPKEDDWSIPELYSLEFHYLNEGFICKATDAYNKFFKDDHDTYKSIKNSKNKTKVFYKGIIRDLFEFKIKKETSSLYGQTMAKVSFEDKNGEIIKCTIFPDKWKLIQEKVKKNPKLSFLNGLAVHFSGTVNIYEDEVGLVLENMISTAQVPPLPSDMKIKKKVYLKDSTPRKSKKEADLFEEVEDSLINDGLIEYDDSFDDSFDDIIEEEFIID